MSWVVRLISRSTACLCTSRNFFSVAVIANVCRLSSRIKCEQRVGEGGARELVEEAWAWAWVGVVGSAAHVFCVQSSAELRT